MKQSNLNEIYANLIRTELFKFFDYFCMSFFEKSSVRSNRIDQLNVIHHFQHLNASYSLYFELSNRTELFKIKHKNNQKVRTRI